MIKNLIKKIKFKTTGIVVVDNFLPEKYCNILRQYSINPPNGYDYKYSNGYNSLDFYNIVGNIPIQVLVKSFSEKINFLGNLKYSRSWSFCYDNKCVGTPPHADPSYININLWLTPDKCVNDFSKNGLKIYHKKRDNNASHKDYNGNNEYINKEIKGSGYTIIPYKYNRATIFLGSMYHKTMGVDMKDGDDNKRVNYTFLFDKVEI